MADKLEQHLGGIEVRVNTLEATFDQQRGARALAYGLIGTNVMAVLVVLWSVLR